MQSEISPSRRDSSRREHKISKLIESKRGQLLSVPGFAMVTTAMLIAELPELGSLSRGQIAKLVCVAPLANQSGKSDKRRKAKGGRSQVRSVLYMATLVATRHPPVIRRFYEFAEVTPERLLSSAESKANRTQAIDRSNFKPVG